MPSLSQPAYLSSISTSEITLHVRWDSLITYVQRCYLIALTNLDGFHTASDRKVTEHDLPEETKKHPESKVERPCANKKINFFVCLVI